MSKSKIDLVADIEQLLQDNPILGAGNYPEAARLVANSGRLYRDLLRELEIYNSDPDCDNVRVWHCFNESKRTAYWINRWGEYVFTSHADRWRLIKNQICANPALLKDSRPAYSQITIVKNGRIFHPYKHVVMSDVFIPNDDFTKTQRDHINGNHLDNNAFNLERVTPEENIRRRYYNYYTNQGRPVPTKYLPQSIP